MAIRKRLSQQEIAERYTHHARSMGIPCYFNVETNDIHEANWVPSFVLTASIHLEIFLMWLMSTLDPSYEPMFMTKLEGEIERA